MISANQLAMKTPVAVMIWAGNLIICSNINVKKKAKINEKKTKIR